MINKIDLTQVKVPSYLRLDGLADELNKNFETLSTAIQSVDAEGIVTVPGPQGDKGEQGIQGLRGEQGPAGVDGKDGLPGKDGVDGKDGLPGKDGINGANGKDGIQGPVGADGVGIKTAAINTATGNLVLTKTDGTTIDAGKVTNPTTSAAGPVVGSAPNPMAPIVVTAPPGYKAANLDDGVELTLDTLAVQLAPSGSRSLQFRVTSGTMSVNISGEIYWCPGNYAGNYGANYWNGNTLTTSYQQIFGWNFPWAGDKAVYNVQDLTNRRLYRITLIIGPGYKKNFIVMERLV